MNTLILDPVVEKPNLIQVGKGALSKFTLVNSSELEIEYSSRRGGNTFRVPLDSLSPNPSVQRHEPRLFTFGVIAVLFVSFVFFVPTVIAIWYGSIAAIMLGLVSIVFGLVGLWEIRRIKRTAFHLIVFENRYTGQAVFSIDVARPDPEKVREFRETLESAIKKAAPLATGGTDASVASQIDRLHRLMLEGVLSESEFSVAKERVLKSLTEDRRIGFGAS